MSNAILNCPPLNPELTAQNYEALTKSDLAAAAATPTSLAAWKAWPVEQDDSRKRFQ